MKYLEQLFNLEGRGALVIGGSGVLGGALALALAKAGARVVIVARRQDVLDQAAQEIKTATEGLVLPISADVMERGTAARVVKATLDEFGRVDIMVNNAGTSRAMAFESVTEEQWEEDFELKVWGAVRFIQTVIPEMRKVGGGRIINVTNIGGRTPGPASMPTSISRAAGIAITKGLSKDLAKDNILVTTVCIGLVKSGQHQRRYDARLEQEPNLAGAHLAAQFGAEGPNFNTLTACAASTQALGEATNIIRYGDADVMISDGTHSMIHPLGMTGFVRLTALSTRNDTPATASRPFDRTRDGFVLGEGAGILILEELEHAHGRGAPVLAEIVGFGSTADAFRITDIHEEGRGGVAAMRGALDSAAMRPEDIDYISAHGTSTEENDKIESLAIRKVFGDHAKKVAISSIKSMTGHLIAAAGAVELITCILAMRDGIVPPTINYEHPDPNCDLDYVPNKSRKMPVRACLSNSFGFGGQNDSLVVRAI